MIQANDPPRSESIDSAVTFPRRVVFWFMQGVILLPDPVAVEAAVAGRTTASVLLAAPAVVGDDVSYVGIDLTAPAAAIENERGGGKVDSHQVRACSSMG